MIISTLLALSLAMPTHQGGDQEYDQWCCSDRDCKPYPAESVQGTTKGYSLADGQFMPYDQTKQSTDGRFHRCDMYGILRCFYAPPQGM